MIDKYQRSPEFRRLSERSREEYQRYHKFLTEKIGDIEYRTLTRRHIVILRNNFSETPRKADYMVSVISALFGWKIAQEDEELENPCKGVKKLQRKSDVEGHLPWTEDQIEFFLANCEPHFRVPVLLGLHTGQRISDCIPMRVTQRVGQTITVVTSKTREFVEILVHPELAEALDNRPHQDQPTFVVGKVGKPYKDVKSFSKSLTAEVRRLKLDGLSFHGLRYAACARLEDIGCSPYEVEDIVGHRTYEMAKKYMSKRRTREKVQSLLQKSAKSDGDPS